MRYDVKQLRLSLTDRLLYPQLWQPNAGGPLSLQQIFSVCLLQQELLPLDLAQVICAQVLHRLCQDDWWTFAS
jgi:hypothetical protein